jgi:hypothetical protein
MNRPWFSVIAMVLGVHLHTDIGFAQQQAGDPVVRDSKLLLDDANKNIAAIRSLFSTPYVSEEQFISSLREQRANASRFFSRIRTTNKKLSLAIDQLNQDKTRLQRQISSLEDLSDEDKAQLDSPGALDYFTQALSSESNSLAELQAQQKDANAKLEELRKSGVNVDEERTKFDDWFRLIRSPISSRRDEIFKSYEDLNPNLKTIFNSLRSTEQQIAEKRSNIARYQKILGEYKLIRAKDVDISSLAALSSELQNAESDLETEINRIDERFLSKINDNRARDFFTSISTAIFGLAVIIVIVFFFRLANNDNVRVALFQNDAGLQFVTLFSIVIAIILFGVLRILEGKELAALLGGLSGYILGRGSISRQPNQLGAPVVAPPAAVLQAPNAPPQI